MNAQAARTIFDVAMMDPRVPANRKRHYYRTLKREWARTPRNEREEKMRRLQRMLCEVRAELAKAREEYGS